MSLGEAKTGRQLEREKIGVGEKKGAKAEARVKQENIYTGLEKGLNTYFENLMSAGKAC